MVVPQAAVPFESKRVKIDLEARRVLIYFDKIPPKAARQSLKSYGFHWSPSVGAWSALLNERSRVAARLALGAALETPDS